MLYTSIIQLLFLLTFSSGTQDYTTKYMPLAVNRYPVSHQVTDLVGQIYRARLEYAWTFQTVILPSAFPLTYGNPSMPSDCPKSREWPQLTGYLGKFLEDVPKLLDGFKLRPIARYTLHKQATGPWSGNVDCLCGIQNLFERHEFEQRKRGTDELKLEDVSSSVHDHIFNIVQSSLPKVLL